MGAEDETLEEVLDRRANELMEGTGPRRRGRTSSRAGNPDSSARSTMRSGLPTTGIMLTPVSPDASVKAAEEDEPTPHAVVEDDNQWLVECIVAHRKRYPKRSRKPENLYRVRWLGYGPEDDEWVREDDIDSTLVNAYMALHDPNRAASTAAESQTQQKKRGRPPKHPPPPQASKKLVVVIPPPEPPRRKPRKIHSVSPLSSTASYRSPRMLYRRLSSKVSDLANDTTKAANQ